MRGDMNWDHIKVFLAVAKTGTVSGAGELLGMTHSTVLRRIDALENQLGIKLFSRQQRRYRITPAGERILDSATMMDRDAQALKRQLVADDSQLKGVLHVAMPPGVCLNLMPQIGEFKRLQPQIELVLESQSYLHNLDTMEADVAIRLTHNPPSHCLAHPLFDIPFAVYAHRDYLDKQPVNRVCDADWLCYDLQRGRTAMANWLRQEYSVSRIVADVNTLALVLQGVLSGVGVSYLPVHIAERYSELEELSLFDFSYRLPVYLLAHRDLCYQPRVKCFMDFMRRELKALPPCAPLI